MVLPLTARPGAILIRASELRPFSGPNEYLNPVRRAVKRTIP
jgi:hypothetical protein